MIWGLAMLDLSPVILKTHCWTSQQWHPISRHGSAGAIALPIQPDYWPIVSRCGS